MKREDLTDEEYAEMVEACESREMDEVVYLMTKSVRLANSNESDRLKNESIGRMFFLDSVCKKCGECASIVLFTLDVHRYKTVCSLCHGYIKHGFPHKHEKKWPSNA